MDTPPPLLEAHHEAVLEVAAAAIRTALEGGTAWTPDPAGFPEPLTGPAATFVTLERAQQLLGCVGTLTATRPLVVDVAHHAIGAAFADPRFPPISHDDYAAMSIRVSVLSHLEPLPATSARDVADAVRPGVDGLVLDTGGRRATLLPSVWRTVPTVDAFLSVLWQKAGLDPGRWPPHARVDRYRTQELHSPGPRPSVTRC